MLERGQGSIRLIKVAGIDLFLHWSWFVVAFYEISGQTRRYSSIGWNIAEYLALFLIVTLHEFGHALACRQVGGTANRIVLWPLGGVAYVDPPPRPGATLWSIAAGPLVNVALVPVLLVVGVVVKSTGLAAIHDVRLLLRAVWGIDLGLLAFNMLPIYPLDGGQILRSLLWFLLGRARSLMVATVLGFIGVVGFVALAIWLRSPWLGVVAVFMLLNCWGGLRQAQALSRLAKLPRREGFVCPRCKAAPAIGNFWKCGNCAQPFDTFQSGGACPYCAMRFDRTRCLDCGAAHPMNEWVVPYTVAPPL
jgi:Zn-dependent protease